MTYIIGDECIDVMDQACLAVCPVDCIAPDSRQFRIDPGACIDCGACEPECPNDAIRHESDL